MNIIKIKVISQDNSQEKVYELKVTKTDNFNLANTNLEILAIENYLIYPAFENSVTEYTTEISGDVETLNIFALPENEQGKVEIYGNNNLIEGNNTITVTVTAQDNISKREYKINVYKRSVNEEKKYKKEEQKQKTEEAYKIEKISTDSSINKKNKENVKIAIFSIILIIFSILILVKKKGTKV